MIMIVLMIGCLANLMTENLEAIDLELSVGAVHPLPSLHARYISTIIILIIKSEPYTIISVYRRICFTYYSNL